MAGEGPNIKRANMSYNPYKRPGFTMSCFNINKQNVRKYLENYEKNSRSEREVNELKKELAKLKKDHTVEIVKTRNQLRQALGVIESNHKTLNEMRVKSIKTDAFNKEKKRVYQSSIPTDKNKSENLENHYGRKSVANEFNKRLTEEEEQRRHSNYQSGKVDSHDVEGTSEKGNSHHQKSGKKISFVPGKTSMLTEKSRYAKAQDETGIEGGESEYDDDNETSDYSEQSDSYYSSEDSEGSSYSSNSESESEGELITKKNKRKQNSDKRKIKFR